MTDNITPINESINGSINTTANNTGYWRPFEKGEFPDITGWLLEIEAHIINALIAWGLDPVHVLFQTLAGALAVIVLYYLFVKTTSSSSKIFSILGYVAVIFIILILLEVI